MRLCKERFDLGGEVLSIDAIDLGCDLQLHAGLSRNPNGAVGRLFRRNATKKSEVAAGPIAGLQQPLRQAMVHRRDVASLWQRLALRIGYRYYRHIGKRPIEQLQFRKVEAAVQGGEEWRAGPRQRRVTEIVAM